MFTLIVQNEQIYQRLMEIVAQHGGSVDDALADLIQYADLRHEMSKVTWRTVEDDSETH